MTKYKTYFAFGLSASVLQQQGKNPKSLPDIARSIDMQLLNIDNASFSAYLKPFTDIDGDNGFYIDIGHAFDIGKQDIFDVAAQLVSVNIESAFRSLPVRADESVVEWIERFTKTVLSNTAAQSEHPFVANANTEENQMSISNIIEKAMRDNFIATDGLMSNASTWDVQKLIRYHFDNRVLRSFAKLWYDAEWNALYDQVVEIVIENDIGHLVKHNGKFSRFKNKLTQPTAELS